MADDIKISIGGNTENFTLAMDKAFSKITEFGIKGQDLEKVVDKAFQQLSKDAMRTVSEIERSFMSLNIKSDFNMSMQRNQLVADKHFFLQQFLAIRDDAKSTSADIQRAFASYKSIEGTLDAKGAGLGSGTARIGAVKEEMDKVATATDRVHQGISGWSLASVAAIAKIQILYSLINSVMSAIGSIPSTAIAAIEDYKSSIITNAALITSQAVGAADIGKEYQKNKVYTEAVEKVLIRMDTETAASYEQLQLMNRAYMLQGVYLDVNNAKAVEGRRNTANALAVIAAGSPNPNMQYGQEIRGLMSGTMREGNMLLQMAIGIDKDIVAKIKRWKEAGTVDENLGKLFSGFAAAQGDINSLWSTVKSTMATIRDEVLRGGLTEGFALIVEKMKEVSKYATENKEKIQVWLKESFADAMSIAKVFGKIGEGVVYIGQPLLWGAITLGIYSAVGAMRTFATSMTIATGGINLILAGLTTLGMYGGKKYFDNKAIDERVQALRSETLDAKITRDQLQAILAENPLASNKDIVNWKDAGALKFGSNFQMNQLAIDYMKQDSAPVIVPNPGKGGKEAKSSGAVEDFDSVMKSWTLSADRASKVSGELESKLQTLLDKYNYDTNEILKNTNATDGAKQKALDLLSVKYDLIKADIIKADDNKKLKDQQEGFFKLSQEIDRTVEAEKRLFNLQNMQTGDLSTKRYNVTKLSDYRLSPNKQYSIPGVGVPISQDKIDEANARIEGITAGLDSRIAADNYDGYDSKLVALKKFHEKELEAILNYTKMEGAIQEKATAAKLKNEEAYKASKSKLDRDTVTQAIGVVGNGLGTIGDMLMKGNKEQFEAGKKFAVASAMINTFMAASNAFAAGSKINIYFGIASAAIAAVAGAAQVAQIESQQYQGRELGGPVTAGQSYIVGEKRPELFTPGASGTITPYVPSQGQGNSVTQVIQVSPGVTDTVRTEMYRMAPMFKQLAVQAVMEAQRGGQLQAA